MTSLAASPRPAWMLDVRLALGWALRVATAAARWLGRHSRWALMWSVLVLVAVLVDDLRVAAVLGGAGGVPGGGLRGVVDAVARVL